MNNISLALEYNYTNFQHVVDAFDSEQIKSFTVNWFKAKEPVKANKLTQKLNENEGLKQIATNPLLLKLLCLVFEETSEFPSSRLQLYSDPQALKKALEKLVERVNDTRWREFLLAAGMLRNADYLLGLIKCQIDTLVVPDEELQRFLAWSNLLDYLLY